ncbi:MAG: FHA domain-containing protein [Planctomycetota bacterium]
MTRALERERRLRGRPVPEAPPVSPLRALLMSGLFYLPLAGLLAGLLAWLILEPHFHDVVSVGGEVVLVNSDPFDRMESLSFEAAGVEAGGAISLTVGAKEVILLPGRTVMEEGASGQAPFGGAEEIEAGDVLEAAGESLDSHRMVAWAVRPATVARAQRTGQEIEESMAAGLLFFPVTAVLIALGMLLAEGLASGNWLRMLERMMLGGLLTVVFSFLAYLPAGLIIVVGSTVLADAAGDTIQTISGPRLLLFAAARSGAWACMGASLGLGMNLVRTTRVQLRNSVVGGTLGGALGGVFFDPLDRFLGSGSFFAESELSRLVGVLAVGVSVGIFVALVDRLAREAWIRVRTGPLAGKSFVLYRTPTILGSAPEADIYLFKDGEIGPRHAAIHRVGNRYEIEDTSRRGTRVAGRAIRRHRLSSGDQIVLGATVLEFEERAKRSPA